MAAGRLLFVLNMHMDTRAHKHRHICSGFPFCLGFALGFAVNTAHCFDAATYSQANIYIPFNEWMCVKSFLFFHIPDAVNASLLAISNN